MIHSGSRNLGKVINDVYDAVAIDFCEKNIIKLPSKELAFLPVDSSDGQKYLINMNCCIDFSLRNRECMLQDVKYSFDKNVEDGVKFEEIINISHNYASLESHFGQNVWVHRKGATSAKKDQLGIIPGNMGDHSFIVKGLGNSESLQSCSHGAGRKMSRGQAKKKISLDSFKKSMEGIVSVDIDKEHLDESPEAYKDISIVMDEQKDLVDIVHILSPLANMKG
jgi:tRNA-splicing ligase RtcB